MVFAIWSVPYQQSHRSKMGGTNEAAKDAYRAGKQRGLTRAAEMHDPQHYMDIVDGSG